MESNGILLYLSAGNGPDGQGTEEARRAHDRRE